MRFVKFKVCEGGSYQEFTYKYSEYINVKKIKSFHVWKHPNGKRGLQLNDGRSKIFGNYKYIPVDKDQFKEAFGLDWDEL